MGEEESGGRMLHVVSHILEREARPRGCQLYKTQ